MSASTRIDRRS